VYAQWFDSGIVTTAADGTATGYVPVASGRVLAIRYVKTDYATPTITITVESTTEPVLTLTTPAASIIKYPRVGIQDEAGGDALYAAAGTKVREAVAIYNDRLKVAITGGGDTKTGRFYALIGG
jgi:hypothetical protein